jgi:hypothetical protein
MKRIIISILGLITIIIVIAVVWEFIYLKTNMEKQIFILPEGFKGIVLIAYDQQDGINDLKQDGKIVYKIPESGVLKLKRETASTLSQSNYYFENKLGQRTEFYYCYDHNEMKKDSSKVYAFGASNGGFENNGERLEITTFWVGSENDRDSLSQVDKKMNPIEMIKRN